MSVMIKLRLPAHAANLEGVQSLPGMKNVPLDARFGVVGIDPRQDLYVVRTETLDGLEERRRLSPEILEAYGDIRISTT